MFAEHIEGKRSRETQGLTCLMRFKFCHFDEVVGLNLKVPEYTIFYQRCIRFLITSYPEINSQCHTGLVYNFVFFFTKTLFPVIMFLYCFYSIFRLYYYYYY